MNETVKNIMNRRSTRTFLPDSVDRDLVEIIVEAGIYAPSSLNRQPWHFTVITDQNILNQLSIDTKEALKNYPEDSIKKFGENEKYHVFYNAPVAIIVSQEDSNTYAPIDCAAASENMLIASESLGLGSCWVGFVNLLFNLNKDKAKEYKSKFNIPQGYSPSHALVFGHKRNVNSNAPKRRENTVSYI
ncbi:MAG: nitroreductase family protein [Paraclostridium sp.]